jgi:methylmalonyl-CoA/ethylmalonyl-CoA epimerase
MMMEFHHIGIACRDIQGFKEILKKMFPGSQESDIVYDAEQGTRLCMVALGNGLNLELIQGKTVENLIKKGITYYHLCFSVDNIDEAIEYLSSRGCMTVKESKPAALFSGKKVAFLHTPLGLIELVEKQE